MTQQDRDDFIEQMEEQKEFEARFLPFAFAEVAKALGAPSSPELLSRLRGWLLPDFLAFYFALPGQQEARNEQVRKLRELQQAAYITHSLLRDVQVLSTLPMSLLEQSTLDDTLFEKLVQVGEAARDSAEKIALRGSARGRRTKLTAFRELLPELMQKYEQAMGEPARRPYWLPDSGIYGSKGHFYEFALAVWRCLRDHLPANASASLPSTEGALAQEIRNHWPEQG
jgi:hypothetical protein